MIFSDPVLKFWESKISFPCFPVESLTQQWAVTDEGNAIMFQRQHTTLLYFGDEDTITGTTRNMLIWYITFKWIPISCFRLNNLGETFLLWNQALGLFAATVWNWTPTDTGECQPADKANSGPASLQLSSALVSLWEKFAVWGIIGRRMFSLEIALH